MVGRRKEVGVRQREATVSLTQPKVTVNPSKVNTMTSSFDPDVFMQQQTDESNSTVFTPVPPDEYMAVISDVQAKMTKTKQGERPVLNVKYEIDSQAVREETGMEKPFVQQTIWLDLTETGMLDTGKGKNVQLGKLREAVGQNQHGRPWAPAMLLGQVVKIVTKLRDNPDNPEQKYSDVSAVAAA
jgi:hypothetical protein